MQEDIWGEEMTRRIVSYEDGYIKGVGNTDDAQVQGSLSAIRFLAFNTGAAYTVTNNGELAWNATDQTLDLKTNASILQMGQELFISVKNQSGSTIPKGTAVRATGAVGASSRFTIAPMVADGSVPSYTFIGLTTQEILNGADGKVTAFGKLQGIDTSLLTDGDILWCDPNTAGALTTTEPSAPNLKLAVAYVVNSNNNGTLFVRANEGSSLAISSDVQITSVNDGQVLTYNATNSRWENQNPQLGFTVTSVKTSAYSANEWEYVPMDVSSSALTLTLPDATTGNGIEVGAKVYGPATNNLTVDTVSSQTIDGNATYVLSTGTASVIFISTGTEWLVKSAYN